MAFPSDLTRTKNWSTEILTDSDLESQFDLIINWVMAALNSTTGHSHDGTSNQGPKIPVTNLTVGSQAQGDLIYASSASAWSRLAKGTGDQLLTMNTGATAPEWKSYSSYVTASNALSGSVVQTVKTTYTTYASLGTTTVPLDDTIPTWAEGNEISGLETTITPTSNSNYLVIDAVAQISLTGTSSNFVAMSIYRDPSGTDAAKSSVAFNRQLISGTSTREVHLRYVLTSPGTSATTFKFRIGGDAADTLVINGKADATAGRILGGALLSSVVIQEIKG